MTTSFRHQFVFSTLLLLLAGGCRTQQQGKPVEPPEAQRSLASEYYTCPMHPSVRSDKPGVCPICHMTLVRVSAGRQPGESSDSSRSLNLTTTEQILANVATTQVTSQSLIKTVTAVGKIDIAEPNTKRITTRFAGRIEKLFISFVGQAVQAGDPVAELYSPDAMSAEREYLVALDSPESQPGAAAMLNETRLKLTLLGFTDQQFRELEKRRVPSPNFIIHAPLAGTVLKKNVDIQQYVSSGESLFDISDLHTVWLQLDVYGDEIGSLRIGQAVDAVIDDGTVRHIRGTLSFVSPTLDASTRTVRVRATVSNSSGQLRPEMFVHADILVPLRKSLVVPATAVIANGRRDIVWVEYQPGHFEPRRVTLGERCGDFFQILTGLSEGESVASRGAYLIDSESQLRMNSSTDGTK